MNNTKRSATDWEEDVEEYQEQDSPMQGQKGGRATSQNTDEEDEDMSRQDEDTEEDL